MLLGSKSCTVGKPVYSPFKWSRTQQRCTQHAVRGCNQFAAFALTHSTTPVGPLFALPLTLQPDGSNLLLTPSPSLNHPTMPLRPLLFYTFLLITLFYDTSHLTHCRLKRVNCFLPSLFLLNPRSLQYLSNSLHSTITQKDRKRWFIHKNLHFSGLALQGSNTRPVRSEFSSLIWH